MAQSQPITGRKSLAGQSRLVLAEHDVERRRAVVALDTADIERILSVRDLVTRNVDAYVATFIGVLDALPEATSLFAAPSILADVRTRKREHLLASVGGEYGVAYAEQRIALGMLYSRVGLEARVFLGAFHGLMSAIGTDIIAAFAADPAEAFQKFTSLKKVGFFDIGIIVDVLIAEREGTITAQQEVIRELSTPVLQFREHLLILPLIGLIDTDRARQLTDDLLRAIRTNRAKAVVVDITGVPVVDSKVAQHLAQTITACQLMGVAAIVTGISGAVAHALVTLGVEIEAFNAVGDLQRGIEVAENSWVIKWFGDRACLPDPVGKSAVSGKNRALGPSFDYSRCWASGHLVGACWSSGELSIMRGYFAKTAWVAAAVLLADAVALPGASAQTAPPAALVEDVSTGVTGVEAFDYVSAGKQIQLGGSGKLVLGYLNSCQEETIVGGIVTVGADQSTVAGGSVGRKTVGCAGKPMQLTAEQSGTSGGLVFRKPPPKNAAPTAPAAPPADRPRVIPSAGPVISVPAPGRVTIARVDSKAAPVVLDLSAKPVDLGKRGVHLAPGGTYRASYGSSAVVFEISAQSTGETSPLARLIRF